jgi:molecular chaperone DnaK
VVVYEGENERVAQNRLLGSFKVQDIPQRARGQVSINVAFDISADGILEVRASVKDEANIANSMRIQQNKGLLSSDEVQVMKREFANNWQRSLPTPQQQETLQNLVGFSMLCRISRALSLLSLCLSSSANRDCSVYARRLVTHLKTSIESAELEASAKQQVLALIAEADDWCANNQYAHPEDMRRKALQLRAAGRKIVGSS